MASKVKKVLSEERQARRELAEISFESFIQLVQPKRLLANIHRRVISFITRQDAKPHQLILLPRDHGKSWVAAFYAAWCVTRNPAIRILYISSTSNLATKQLKFIKDILTSDTYRIYWPEMVEKEEAKREKWTEREISVDHPLRKDEAIRDPTVFTAGLTTNIVGMHCDLSIYDDVVVQANAYTEEGREKVKDQYSLLASIDAGVSKQLVVGTRYHPKDLYSLLMEMEIERYDELGNKIDTEPLFEKIEESVESVGDGTGEFLWPRQQRTDGKWFGFDQDILARKRAQYLNKIHFRAQYYNDPHDVDSSVFKRDLFQYYEPGHLTRKDGRWFFKGEPLNVFAAVDFAFTLGKRSDYSSIVVVGVDARTNYYVLEIERFKTDRIAEYFNRILKMFEKWGFRRMRAEVTAAQQTIVKDIKENYIRPLGLSLVIEEFRPTRWLGAKEERIMAALEPKYSNRQIWHYPGGNCQILEEELMFANPAHDDVKDALASVVDFATGQSPLNLYRLQKANTPAFQFHSKFGGVA